MWKVKKNEHAFHVSVFKDSQKTKRQDYKNVKWVHVPSNTDVSPRFQVKSFWSGCSPITQQKKKSCVMVYTKFTQAGLPQLPFGLWKKFLSQRELKPWRRSSLLKQDPKVPPFLGKIRVWEGSLTSWNRQYLIILILYLVSVELNEKKWYINSLFTSPTKDFLVWVVKFLFWEVLNLVTKEYNQTCFSQSKKSFVSIVYIVLSSLNCFLFCVYVWG